MKKYLCFFFAVIMVFSVMGLSACSKKGGADAEPREVASLLCDRTEVSAGENVEVILHLKACAKVACFQFELTGEGGLAYESGEQLDAGGFVVLENQDNGVDTVAGYVVETKDVEEHDFYSFLYSVPKDAKSGDELKLTLSCSQFMIGLDDSGEQTEDICAAVAPVTLSFTVK